jgi:magnesium-protoporphyrin O-methyltransferase
MLLDQVIGRGVKGRSFLDIGGGIGAIQHELMEAGARRGLGAEASPAYLAASREEAERRGYADRMAYREGDFLDLAPEIEAADVVTLDRVLCCYPDMPGLVEASASRARLFWGTVLPREERPLIRLAIGLLNAVQRLRRRPFRVFTHCSKDVDVRMRVLGFSPAFQGTSFFWRILLYERDPAATSL